MLAERPIRILRSLGSLNKGREVALGRGEEEGVVHESVSGIPGIFSFRFCSEERSFIGEGGIF